MEPRGKGTGVGRVRGEGAPGAGTRGERGPGDQAQSDRLPGDPTQADPPPDHPTPYQLAQRQGQEAMRRTLLDAASRLLLEEGPGALTMRRVAGAVGCSTTVLYTMFGAKEGLADALYREGFERLRRRLEAAGGDPDPLGRLRALGRAYRASALAEPGYYGVMFQQAIPGFRPSAESLVVAGASLEVLTQAVRAAMEAGGLRAGDPRAVAEVLWAAVHGVVSLELAGHFADPEVADDRFQTLASAAILPFLPRPDPPTTRRH
jgi:AcrR family transcriptional regulator